ncbi:hypothetical protein [Mucisphaera sp.]|uniref:hypothetical protein n=1 Tax=Mucisphaera sp. TaxID=2913024 RepID=UPI003D14B0E5
MIRTAAVATCASLLLVLGGCSADSEGRYRFDPGPSAQLFSSKPAGHLGSGDALGERLFFQQPEVVATLELSGEIPFEASAKSVASKVLEDYYAVEPMTAADLREAFHPGIEPTP